MGIFNFKDFSVNERLGVAEPTLFYIETIFNHTMNYLKDFIKSEDNELDESITIPYRRFYRNIKDRNLYSKFPVVGISLNLKFDKLSPYRFNKRYKIDENDTKRSKHAVSGWASRFGHINWTGYSKITNPIKKATDHGIIIDIGINITISKNYKLEGINLKKISDDINETIWHELNHSYEYYNRLIRGRGPIYKRSPRLAITNTDINSWKISKKIYDFWNNNFIYYLYVSEKHEMNAQVQEAAYHVSKYGINSLYNTNAWEYAKYMESFDPDDFIYQLEEIIMLEGKDIQKTKDSLKKMWLFQYRKYVEEEKEDHSINDRMIEHIDFNQFVYLMGRRLNRCGKKLKNKLVKLYEFDPNVTKE
jgi:hypothetical protein